MLLVGKSIQGALLVHKLMHRRGGGRYWQVSLCKEGGGTIDR